MALTTAESIFLTFAIVGSVHLLVTLLQAIENDEGDHRDFMKTLAKHKFLKENALDLSTIRVPYYH